MYYMAILTPYIYTTKYSAIQKVHKRGVFAVLAAYTHPIELVIYTGVTVADIFNLPLGGYFH